MNKLLDRQTIHYWVEVLESWRSSASLYLRDGHDTDLRRYAARDMRICRKQIQKMMGQVGGPVGMRTLKILLELTK